MKRAREALAVHPFLHPFYLRANFGSLEEQFGLRPELKSAPPPRVCTPSARTREMCFSFADATFRPTPPTTPIPHSPARQLADLRSSWSRSKGFRQPLVPRHPCENNASSHSRLPDKAPRVVALPWLLCDTFSSGGQARDAEVSCKGGECRRGWAARFGAMPPTRSPLLPGPPSPAT